MIQTPLILRMPCIDDEASFKDAVRAFKKEAPSFPFAFDYTETEPFHRYVERVENWSRGLALPERFVPNTFFVGVVGDTVVGRVSIRHRLNDFLRRIGGHIGYAVVPEYRRQGIATQLLSQSLPVCASLGIENALITCDVDNIPSIKVIERCGGQFEALTDEPELTVQKRRYRINLNVA